MTLRLADIHKKPEASGTGARIASYIAARGIGTIVTREELFDLCWGRRPDGGPLDVRNNLNVHIALIRKMLRPEWKIRAIHSVGFELVFVPVAAAQERAA